MAQYSPKLIEQTISVFENRIGRDISKEEARQAVENISGFFQVLQEWVEAEEDGEGSEKELGSRTKVGGRENESPVEFMALSGDSTRHGLPFAGLRSDGRCGIL